MLPKLAIGQFNLIGFPVAAMALFTWCLLLSTVPAVVLCISAERGNERHAKGAAGRQIGS